MDKIKNFLVDAFENNDIDSIKHEISKGISPDYTLDDGYTLLMLCAGNNQLDIARFLLKNGSDPNITNEGGTSALKIACLKEDLPMMKLLLENKANPNSYDKKGFTPLMYTAMNGCIKPAELLLEYGADTTLRSISGKKSACEFAKENFKDEMVTFLENKDGSKRKPSKISAPKSNDKKQKLIDPDKLVGQETAKNKLAEIIALSNVNQERIKRDLPEMSITLHAAFIGNPGTGKTTFARYYAQEVKKLGILDKGHLVEVTRRDLVAEFTGQTAIKTEKVFKSALGGILFIDEAYSLKTGKDDNFGQECIDTLVTLVENYRNEAIVILAGYMDEMHDFLNTNTGLKSRIPNLVYFVDFTDKELQAIMKIMLKNVNLKLDDKGISYAMREVLKRKKERSFGNAREVRNLLDRAIAQQSVRLSKKTLSKLSKKALTELIYSDLTVDPNDEATFEQALKAGEFKQENPALKKLLDLVGLKEIKREIKSVSDFVKVSKARYNNALPEIGLHMIFKGNPGTGKTTVARLLAEIFKDLDFLSTGHLVEADRSKLVAPYVGQTAIKTREIIEEALGGVLFIDEAYTLHRGGLNSDNFGQEAIDTLLKFMEDYRNRLIIVLSGYPQEMDTFLSSNPGLASRFSKTFLFEDYPDSELVEIARLMAKEKKFTLSHSSIKAISEKIKIERETCKGNFANARFIRNVLEHAYKNQASRILKLGDLAKVDKKVINTLEAEDFSIKN